MSTSPYSIDLRNKVIKFIQSGKSQKEASSTFNIHKNTINRWVKRLQAEGHYKAKTRLGKKSKVDLVSLESHIKAFPSSKLKDIGNVFNISAWHVSRLLHKLGYSYKKKPSPMWKQTSQNETIIRKK
jgi:transposase